MSCCIALFFWYTYFMDTTTILFAILSLFGWGVGSFFSKLAANRIGEQSIFWDLVGYVPGALLYCLFAYRVKDLLVGDKMGILYGLLAGFIGSIGIIGFYFVMTRKDASAAVPLTALYPALTAILAFIFLREQLTFIRVAGIILATIAVILLSL